MAFLLPWRELVGTILVSKIYTGINQLLRFIDMTNANNPRWILILAANDWTFVIQKVA